MVERDQLQYDVCLSFAGERREYVEQVAKRLKGRGLRVFYDRFEEVDLWGKDLYEHLADVYKNQARYCVIFASREYAEKMWTTHERRNAQARALREHREYILPVRFDETEIPGIPETTGYLDANRISHKDLADKILEKVGRLPRDEYMPPELDLFLDIVKDLTKELETIKKKKLPSSSEEELTKKARKLFEIIRRMSREERQVVLGSFLKCCAIELPDYVHCDLAHLQDLTGFPVSKIRRLLSSAKTLGFFSELVVGKEIPEDSFFKDIEYKEPQLVVAYHPYASFSSVPGDETIVAFALVQSAIVGFCENHGLEMLARADFSGASIVTTREDHHDPQSESEGVGS